MRKNRIVIECKREGQFYLFALDASLLCISFGLFLFVFDRLLGALNPLVDLQFVLMVAKVAEVGVAEDVKAKVFVSHHHLELFTEEDALVKSVGILGGICTEAFHDFFQKLVERHLFGFLSVNAAQFLQVSFLGSRQWNCLCYQGLGQEAVKWNFL